MNLRLWLGIAGVIAAAVAVALDSRIAAWGAVALLAISIGLRIQARRAAAPGAGPVRNETPPEPVDGEPDGPDAAT